MYKNDFYKKYKKNVHSQNGEDGIIEELLKRLNIKNGWVCEFGAWDGKHLSNTFKLVEEGFTAVYIESDSKKYKDLLKTTRKHENIIPIHAFVEYNKYSSKSLDNLLSTTEIPIDFDVLSIDIDSYDYQIWKSVKKYKPKIVVIEINSSANIYDLNHIHEPNKYQGTSFAAMYNLAVEKGYKFVLHTGNLIFIKEELFDKINVNYEHPNENFISAWNKSAAIGD